MCMKGVGMGDGGLTMGRASPSSAASAVQKQVRRDVYVVVRMLM